MEFDDFTVEILKYIKQNKLEIKVQIGIWINNDDFSENTNKILNTIKQLECYEELIIGISLQNENEKNIKIDGMLNIIKLFKKNFENFFLCTANFLSESINEKNIEIFNELDYINVNYYPNYFNFKNNHTPEKQVNKLINKDFLMFIPKNKFIVLGETGWQSYNSSFKNASEFNLIKYFLLVKQNIHKTQFSFMFYFNLCDQEWKGKDDHWGLFNQGNIFNLENLKYHHILMASKAVISHKDLIPIPSKISETQSFFFMPLLTNAYLNIKKSPLPPELIRQINSIKQIENINKFYDAMLSGIVYKLHNNRDILEKMEKSYKNLNGFGDKHSKEPTVDSGHIKGSMQEEILEGSFIARDINAEGFDFGTRNIKIMLDNIIGSYYYAGSFQKYFKYKTKYLNLKKELNKF